MTGRLSEENGDRKQKRSQRREQEILRAALRTFARDGISRARIGDIASEAGMPVSSLYDYFSSKEELAYAVPREHLARFFTDYITGEAPLSRLQQVLHHMLNRNGDIKTAIIPGH